ncbi:MAG: WD40 repeat domain-containing protein [Saccharospirillum sp.]|nr:WD40 repeat domain-containing protein [Saccharospirillum sp.]
MKPITVGALVATLVALSACDVGIPEIPTEEEIDQASLVLLDSDIVLRIGTTTRVDTTLGSTVEEIEWEIDANWTAELTIDEGGGFIEVYLPWQAMADNELTLKASVIDDQSRLTRLDWALPVQRQAAVLFTGELSRQGDVELYRTGLEESLPVRLHAPFTTETNLGQVQVSPSGHQLTFAREQPASALNPERSIGVWMVDLASGADSLLPLDFNSNGAVINLVWSPDGQYLASLTAETGGVSRTLTIFDPEQTAPLYQTNTLAQDHLSWSKDGQYLAYLSTTSVLNVVDTASGESSAVPVPADAPSALMDIGAFDWSPVDNQLALLAEYSNADVRDLMRYDPEQDATVLLAVHAGHMGAATYGDIVDFSWSPLEPIVAFLADFEAADQYALFSVEADAETPMFRKVSGNHNSTSVLEYQWSPTGERLAYLLPIEGVEARYHLYSSRVNGTQNRSYNLSGYDRVRYWNWIPQLDELIFVHFDEGQELAYFFHVDDPDRNDSASILKTDEGEDLSVWTDAQNGLGAILPIQWTRNGERFAFRGHAVSGEDALHLYAYSLDGGSLKTVSELVDSVQRVAADFVWSDNDEGLIYRLIHDSGLARELVYQPLSGDTVPLVGERAPVQGELASGGEVVEIVALP